MKVLLVARTGNLFEILSSCLNPELEYCAIIVSNVETAKDVLSKVGLSQDLLYCLDDIKQCIKKFPYDYILCIDDGWGTTFLKLAQECSVPDDKIVALNIPSRDVFTLERSLRYFREHATEFEGLATGISYAETGLNVTRFKRKLFNFARSSQDLYYNFQTAKFALLCEEGHSTLRYALIGLAPYSFHCDLSKSSTLRFLMLWYLVAFNDLHNFRTPVEIYRKFLREDYLTRKVPLESLDINDPFYVKTNPAYYLKKGNDSNENIIAKISSQEYEGNVIKEAPIRADGKGGRKEFPETCKENIKILDDYLTLCEENNILPIMFLAPMPQAYMENYSKPQIEELRYLVGEACLKHPTAHFVDGWKLNFITDNDFYDKGHMNLQGATKFSDYLNAFIEKLSVKKSYYFELENYSNEDFISYNQITDLLV